MTSVSVAPILERILPEERRRLRDGLETADPVSGDLYRLLNEFLQSGDNDRFVLYCPLRLVPNADWYRRYDESVDVFSELYVQSWFRLLEQHDLAANFTDGDVPDIELAVEDLPMRVQAAYLAPDLEHSGLITRSQMPKGDPVLDRSIKDAYAATNIGTDWVFGDVRSFSDSVEEALNRDMSAEQAVGLSKGFTISEKRAKWLHWEERRKIKQLMVRSASKWFQSGTPIESLGHLTPLAADVALHAIGLAIELSENYLWPRYASTFRRFHLNGYDVSTVLNRLYFQNFVDKKVLDEFGVFSPNLAGPLHSNLDPLAERRTEIQKLVQDERISNFVYPAAIIFGSRLKGYGDANSDLDIAVFIKPDCLRDTEDRKAVTAALQEVFGERVLEFWLDEKGDSYYVHDFPDFVPHLGNSIKAHVLLAGAWEGDAQTIDMLHWKLIRPYFAEENQAIRRIWTGELERDLLQYRLLHRGYERYYPVVDQGCFLDPGYRMLASKLFLSHVHIPPVEAFDVHMAS